MGLFIVAMLAAIFVLSRRKQKQSAPPTTRVEFWIYSDKKGRPTDTELLKRMTAENPLNRSGNFPIGPKEGLTLSDIRFHVGVALKESNRTLFRPDMLCESDANPSEKVLEGLAKADCLIRIQYLSEEPLSHRAYLTFVNHCCSALAAIQEATCIFDLESQRFWTQLEFFKNLESQPDGLGFAQNVTVRWVETVDSGTAMTRGMAKIGLPDLVFGPVPLDLKTLATHLVSEAGQLAWENGNLAEQRIEAFGEQFKVVFDEPRNSKLHRGQVCDLNPGRVLTAGS